MPLKEPVNQPALEYQIIYSQRKTIELRFDHENLLIIKAPYKTSKKRLEDVLRIKADWIEKTRARLSQRWHLPQMIQGEPILVLGEWLALNLQTGTSNKVDLSTPGVLTLSQELAKRGTDTLISLYRQLTRQYTQHYARIYSQRYQLQYSNIRVTSAKTRWGSCSLENSLNFSWRLAMTPLLSIEYVVAHELAHTKHRNHSKAFWQFLSEIMPNYKEGQLWLKQNGSKLPAI